MGIGNVQTVNETNVESDHEQDGSQFQYALYVYGDEVGGNVKCNFMVEKE